MTPAPRAAPPPEPEADERPARYADRVGAWYVARLSAAERRRAGLFLTPVAVAEFMAGMLEAGGAGRLLDPAAGAGVLLAAAVERLVAGMGSRRLDLTAWEVDSGLVGPLRSVLDHAAAWAWARGALVRFRVETGDFVLAHAGALAGDGPPPAETFDAVIANPPYFKIPRADPRAAAAAAVIHGQPNIYGLFLAASATLLRPGGRLVAITPRSFASGPYFRALRRHLFRHLRPLQVHVFASRKEAFRRDAVLQEIIVFHGERQDTRSPAAAPRPVAVSTSRGAADLREAAVRLVPLGEVVRDPEGDALLRLSASAEEAEAVRLVESWPGSLAAYGLSISTGPVVPFRATEFIVEAGEVPGAYAPLLWLGHVTAMRVAWPLGGRKPEYIRAAARPLLLPARAYVLLRRFSAKEERRRLVAAPLLPGRLPGPLVGLENHLNYLHRPGGELCPEEVLGLAALYNSALLDTYFRTLSGSTQVGAAELRAVPLPPRDQILDLGRRVRRLRAAGAAALPHIDALVADLAATHSSRGATWR